MEIETSSQLSGEAANGSAVHGTSLEALLQNLNRQVPAIDPPQRPEGTSELEQFPAPDRMDTGFVLREMQGYQSQRGSVLEQDIVTALNGTGSTREATTNDITSLPRTSSRETVEDDHTLTPRATMAVTPSIITRTVAAGQSFQIDHLRMLQYIIIGQVCLQVTLALCVSGVVGLFGYFAAGAVLGNFVAVTFVSIIFRVYIEVKELRVERRQTQPK